MSNILPSYQLLELNVISAQDLALVGRSMRSYAVAWIDPDRKLSTRVDSHGGVNPTWNDKFVFRVDEDFLYDEEAVITIDIYAIHWFKDIHVGTAHVLAAEHMPPPTTTRPYHNTHKNAGMQFVGLQVHRPSGRPKGILNVGVAVLDSTMRSMPLYNPTAVGYHHDDMDIDQLNLQQDPTKPKPELRRTKSDTSSMIGPEAVAHEKRTKVKKGKASSVVTASEVSLKSKKKGGSTLSGSDVRPKSRKGKSEKVKKASKLQRSPEPNIINNNYIGTPQRKGAGYEVNQSPNPQYWNSPAMAYNNINRGGVRATPLHGATPLHAYAAMNAAMEYGTPYRSDLGRPMMTDSELGPSASEVAAAVARQPVEEGDTSTIGGWSLDESVEGLKPRVERWRTDLPTVYDNGGDITSTHFTKSKKDNHSRRHTDGDDEGLFSCFSVICGVECSIVCGGDRKKKKKNRRRRAQSADDASFL
ncbi:hypothetical protein S245_040162 [Arachis hypogaea]|uniref:C2 domain-containing protein n=1 Tax=Arachis hypogaea TaxID=3818 RepID=A0A445AH50_ARAHY|nr:hypothetical protein Ahy_B02g059715 [Arachis hypogaea]